MSKKHIIWAVIFLVIFAALKVSSYSPQNTPSFIPPEDKPEQSTLPQTIVRPGIINTVAGIGSPGFSGDDGLYANQAQLNYPCAVKVDHAGNINILDCGNNRVRRVYPDGTITTIAGNGKKDFFMQNIQAERFSFKQVSAIVADNNNNIYVADEGYNRIFKIDRSRTLTVYAGNGKDGRAGDGKQAASAAIGAPSGLAIDNQGNIYVSQRKDHVIRKITLNGVISTLAGTGEPGYSGDGGQAALAQFNAPACIDITTTGVLLVADLGNQAIRRINNDNTITTILDNKKMKEAYVGANTGDIELQGIYNLAADNNGNLLISDAYSNRIFKMSPDGKVATIAGSGTAGYSGDGGKALAAKLNGPQGINVDSNGNLFIADAKNNVVRQVYFPPQPE
ncbi:sugar lactone lactonase YvrE [Elusimicrobium simillimum]|uniref:NHL domain-containing protein n=1 Tax=Elusimicrobium simillimum TaxID=3143438 RepID=UPI003C6F08D8